MTQEAEIENAQDWDKDWCLRLSTLSTLTQGHAISVIMKVCIQGKPVSDLVKQVEAMKINEFLEINFSQTLIFIGSFIEFYYWLLISWQTGAAESYNPDRNAWELYNALIKVRFVTSKTKLDI